MIRPPTRSTILPTTTLFLSLCFLQRRCCCAGDFGSNAGHRSLGCQRAGNHSKGTCDFAHPKPVLPEESKYRLHEHPWFINGGWSVQFMTNQWANDRSDDLDPRLCRALKAKGFQTAYRAVAKIVLRDVGAESRKNCSF